MTRSDWATNFRSLNDEITRLNQNLPRKPQPGRHSARNSMQRQNECLTKPLRKSESPLQAELFPDGRHHLVDGHHLRFSTLVRPEAPISLVRPCLFDFVVLIQTRNEALCEPCSYASRQLQDFGFKCSGCHAWYRLRGFTSVTSAALDCSLLPEAAQRLAAQRRRVTPAVDGDQEARAGNTCAMASHALLTLRATG